MKHRTRLAGFVFMCLVLTAIAAGQESVPRAASFTTWKTIKLGTHKNVDTLRQALQKQGYAIGYRVDDILNNTAFTVSPTETTIDLVVVTVRELGFPEGATRKEIYDRALEQGFSLCPNEVGPQLRLQYPDQPIGESVLIAMESITGSFKGMLCVFYITHYRGVRWLQSDDGRPGIFRPANDRWVFARLRQAKQTRLN